MNEFPKWKLALSSINLIPVLLSPFFLFGAQPLGTSDSGALRFLLYVLTQLFWLLPLILFFVSLDAYRRGYTKRAILFDVIGLAATVSGICLLFFF